MRKIEVATKQEIVAECMAYFGNMPTETMLEPVRELSKHELDKMFREFKDDARYVFPELKKIFWAHSVIC